MNRIYPANLLALALPAFVVASPGLANAADAPGFALNRYEPSERGSQWFSLESLDFGGRAHPALGVTADYAYRPQQVVSTGPGSPTVNVVREQLGLHLGGAMTFADRFQLGLSLPVYVVNAGTDAVRSADGRLYRAPTGPGLGDLRLGVMMRMVGDAADSLRIAAGVKVWVPTGDADKLTSDGAFRVQPHVDVAGDLGAWTYAARGGFLFRGVQDVYAMTPLGHEVTFGAAAGLRLLDGAVLVGPELLGSYALESHKRVVGATHPAPVSALLGARYRRGDLVFGLAAGGGLAAASGVAVFRALASVEWAPVYVKPAAPIEADSDEDGIADAADACVQRAGVASADPSRHGCPADRDGDGIADAEDACAAVPGVESADARMHGCPADEDGDGVPDAQDACVHVAGVASTVPTANGCPADQDGDGVADSQDACVDVIGAASDDARTNGCPAALLVPSAMPWVDETLVFRSGDFEIARSYDAVLDRVAEFLKSHRDLTRVHVDGHTDDRGEDSTNRDLSAKRARTVIDALVRRGVARGRFVARSYGAAQPVDRDATDAARAKNRRVELHLGE